MDGNMKKEVNVVIVGAGPAGSLAACFLKNRHPEKEWKVTVFEKERMPREHVGESLQTSLPYILSLLNLNNKFTAMEEPTTKVGARLFFRQKDWNGPNGEKVDNDDVLELYTQLGWVDDIQTTFQYRRDALDLFLLNHARSLGAVVHEGTKVVGVDLEKRTIRFADTAAAEMSTSNATSMSYDWLLDCSGGSHFLHKPLGVDPGYLKSMDNIAVMSWYEGSLYVKTPHLKPTITVHKVRDPDAWLWFIPSGKDILSIGVVMSRADYAVEKNQKGKSYSDILAQAMNQVSELDTLLGPNAKEIRPPRAIPDRSHRTTGLHDPSGRAMLLGDSACFIDPFLSTGFHMASFCALTAACVVHSVENGNCCAVSGADWYEKMVFRQYARLQWVVGSVLNVFKQPGCKTEDDVLRDMHWDHSDLVFEVVTPTVLSKPTWTYFKDVTDEEKRHFLRQVYMSWEYYTKDLVGECTSTHLWHKGKHSAVAMMMGGFVCHLFGGFSYFFGDFMSINHINKMEVDVECLDLKPMGGVKLAVVTFLRNFAMMVLIPTVVLLLRIASALGLPVHGWYTGSLLVYIRYLFVILFSTCVLAYFYNHLELFQ